MGKKEANKKEQPSKPISTTQQTTTIQSTKTKINVHDAIHQWASQAFGQSDMKPKEIKGTTFTIAPMIKIQRHTTTHSSEILGSRIL